MNTKLLKNNKLFSLWERLRATFWFLPSLLVVGTALIALVLVQIDGALDISQHRWLEPLVYSGGTQAARQLLSTIGSSMLTVAGTVFSVTIAALTLAASSYGPRLLRNFIEDRGNQLVLGLFVATFLYCLLVLRSISDVQSADYVPQLSTTFAIVLALVDVGVLIYFIHHIAASIQISSIVKSVGDDVLETIDRVFPEGIGHGADEHAGLDGAHAVPPPFAQHSVPIRAQHSGYVQLIGDDDLLHLMSKHDLVAALIHRPGHFVVAGDPLLRVWPPEHVNDAVCRQARETFTLGKQRTPTQDIEFALLELVEVAVRALSPSMNDPYTAVNSLDQLSVALCTLAERPFPSPRRYDKQHHLRVIAAPVTFEHILNIAFDQIRMNGSGFVMVFTKSLDVIARVAARVHDGGTLAALRHHAQLVKRSSRDGIADEYDRQHVEHHYQATMHTIAEREAHLHNHHFQQHQA